MDVDIWEFLLSSQFFCVSKIVLYVCMLSHFSHVQLFVTLRTLAYQAPLSMEFPRQEYWSRWWFPSPGDLPDPGIEPGSPTLWADTLHLSHLGSPVYTVEGKNGFW